ncbi:MAG TPA: hypothetical protein VGA78_08690 [Gemmatimonadales bacterium]
MKRPPDSARVLLTLLAEAERGPRRDGTFAVWLTLRVAVDVADQSGWTERAHRKRLQAVEGRLTSLSLPSPLRRALAGTLAQLWSLTPEAAGLALTHLVAPVRESLGADAAEAVRRVAVSLRGR